MYPFAILLWSKKSGGGCCQGEGQGDGATLNVCLSSPRLRLNREGDHLCTHMNVLCMCISKLGSYGAKNVNI